MGHPTSFDHLVESYQSLVYRTAVGMTANAHDAEDVAQDVFTKVYLNLSKLDDPDRIKSWIIKITVNHCKTFLIKKKLKTWISFDYLTPSQEPEDKTENPACLDDTLDQENRVQILNQTLNQLPLIQREILTLKDLNQLTYQEISDLLNLPIGTIQSRHYRAKEKLKTLLSSHPKKEVLVAHV